MLKQITIQNYALIEESSISFPEGLTVITGETGAGKSILLGALGLILGQRADIGVLRDKTKKCIIEGVFNIKAYRLKNFFNEQELDYEDETSLRREINPEGKSRAFINDTPVNLNVLKQLAEQFIDIHSQHETLLLNDTAFQFEVVDAFAELKEKKISYRENFLQLKHSEKQLQDLQDQELQTKKDLDYYTFQFNELEQATVVAGEMNKLEQESDTLNNAETIKSGLNRVYFALNGNEENIVTQLSLLKTTLAPLSKYGRRFEELHSRLNSGIIELKDLANEINNADEDIVFDPERLLEVDAKLDLLNRLLKKHNVQTEEDLLRLKEELEERLNAIGSIDDKIALLSKEVKEQKKKVTQQADELSAKRKKAIPEIEKKIKEMLGSLAMPHASFKIDCQAATQFNNNGADKLNFLFSANKGSEFKELHKVASGGELSRLMLCIKALIAQLTSLPTIIFDEIDTGVSGDVAHKVGGILEKMAKGMQVITITHLPQIACKGKSHLFVYKHEQNDKTVSEIKALNKDERIVEIAKMLSTGKPTEAAINNAKELIG